MADRTDRLRNVAVPSHHLSASTTTGAVVRRTTCAPRGKLILPDGRDGCHLSRSAGSPCEVVMSEVALDFGRIHSGKAEEDIRELDLELK